MSGSGSTRQPLTKRQLDRLRQRIEVDERDYYAQRFEAGLGGTHICVDASIPDHGITICIHDTDILGNEQALLLATALREATEFITYGPGKWVEGVTGRYWQSDLDADGNDRQPKGSGEVDNL